jgi:hypothetical protein
MKKLINEETGEVLSDCRCNFQNNTIDGIITLNESVIPVNEYNPDLHTQSLTTTELPVFEFLNDLGINFFHSLEKYSTWVIE